MTYTNETMPIHIIYIPGLGDGYDIWRRIFLWCWRIYGVSTELIPIKWSDREGYEVKLALVNAAIARAKGRRVVLLGESAGGSLALNVYASRPDDFYKVLTICGKNARPEHVAPHFYQRNPAFKTSMHMLNDSIKKLTPSRRRAFISIHPLIDRVVPINETIIPGCQRRQVWLFGHLPTIAIMLTIGSWYVVRQIRR